MNSDAIEGTRILSQKNCSISSSNNSLKITKFSKNKSKPWEKINIKTKSFVKQIKQNKQKSFLTIKKIQIYDNPNTRKKKTRLKIRKNKERNNNINNKNNCRSIRKSKILNNETNKRKCKNNNLHIQSLPVIK